LDFGNPSLSAVQAVAPNIPDIPKKKKKVFWKIQSSKLCAGSMLNSLTYKNEYNNVPLYSISRMNLAS